MGKSWGICFVKNVNDIINFNMEKNQKNMIQGANVVGHINMLKN